MHIHILKGGENMAKVLAFISALSPQCAWVMEVKKFQRRRSSDQNSYLWGIVYATICKQLEGWEPQDVHEYCLGEWSGWETVEGLGRKRLKPVRRSSKLSVKEFAEYVDFIQRRMAEHGIYIESQNERAA